MVEPVNLNQVAKQVLHILQVSTSKKIELHQNLLEPLPAINADSTQIHQVIMNLALNAIEAIGDQSGIVTLRTGTRECGSDDLSSPWLQQDLPGGTYVFIEASDTGCGIPPGNMARIFDPFFTTKFIGRGLGLAAVLGIVRGHSGIVKVQSEEGAGSTFQVLFPIVRK
jgi:signal transduction histidine kinase